MKNDIAFISTNPVVTAGIKSALLDRGLDYPVITTPVSDVVSVAEKMILSGAKVLVSRGGATGRIQKYFNVPVVDLRHSCMDVYQTYEKVRELVGPEEQIGYVGYENVCNAVRNFNRIKGWELFVVEQLNNNDQIEEKVKSIAEKGIRVVCGGIAIADIAPIYGLQAVMGRIHHLSIDNAINEALHALHLDRITIEKYETIRSVLNNITEGVIGFDSEWQISQINPPARKMLGNCSVSHIKEQLHKCGIIEQLSSGNIIRDGMIMIENSPVVVHGQPIEVEGTVNGGVLTLQEEAEIEAIGRRIKRKHTESGHVAKNQFHDIVGCSDAMESVKKTAIRYAASDSTVMIFGETGTGKELFAQSIHNASMRRNKPFVAVNCAALPREILESELFGYVKGAFTGARSDGKIGIFEMASSGTVFLDEIGEMTIDVQAKLLRVLQEKEIRRIGDDKIIPIDVRVIAATNKNLLEEVQKGSFRADLYYRLCVLELYIPPLRERKSDIEQLAKSFLEKQSNGVQRISESAISMLEKLEWPGNVRQLYNLLERMVVLCEKDVIDEETVISATGKTSATPSTIGEIKESFGKSEAEIIEEALRKNNGDRSSTAAELHCSTTTLWRKIKKYSITFP